MKKKKLSCEQINALLYFYAENTLNIFLKKLVKEHLENCPECMANYRNIVEKFNDNINKENSESDSENFETEQYKKFRTNLSAYIDNELSTDENIKIKKFAISNPLARKDLENIYKFKNMLYNSFIKTKDDLKIDYSKTVTNIIQKDFKQDNIITPFIRVWIIYFGVVIALTVSFIYILYS